MGISTEKAYEILNLPLGASKDAIEQSYKKLAYKWHPEKHTSTQHTQEALKKFKSISIAFRKLINNERDDKDMSLHEMFQQYRQVFHNKNKKDKIINNNGNKLNCNGSGNKDDNSQDEDDNDSNSNSDDENLSDDNHEDFNDDISIKLKARSYAIKGNDLAFHGQYEKAIEQFSEAIKLDSSDFKFYGNRSYCYDKLNLYEEALRDAEKAISIEPSWPKGYYRKGRALSGLKNYNEAEIAYEKVYELDNTSDNSELIEELHKVRALQLQEMGFSKNQSENSIKQYHTIEAALESILSFANNDLNNSDYEENDDQNNNNFKNSNKNNYTNEYNQNYNDSNNKNENTNLNDINNNTNNLKIQPLQIKTTNTSTVSTTTTAAATATATSSATLHSSSSTSSASSSSSSSIINGNSHINEFSNKTLNGNHNYVDSNNNNNNKNKHLTSLWIGNVDPKVTEKRLADLFGECGEVTTVRCLAEKYCAFVNFKYKEDATKAMQRLQGKLVEGQKLLIKYPDNPNTSILNTNQLKLKSSTSNSNNNNNNSNDNNNTIITNKKDNTTIILKQVNKSTITNNSNNSSSNNNQTTTTTTTNGNSDNTIILTNNKQNSDTSNNNNNNINNSKLTGPVNGNECYFWRTTGCVYADKCRYLHISKNKGIDKKPWHKAAI